MSNFLLVSETKANGEIDGVSPQMAAAIAAEFESPLKKELPMNYG